MNENFKKTRTDFTVLMDSYDIERGPLGRSKAVLENFKIQIINVRGIGSSDRWVGPVRQGIYDTSPLEAVSTTETRRTS